VPGAEPGAAPRRVWDPLLRLLHWLLAACVVAAWLTRAGWGKWHEWIGYATLVLVALRLVWGWIGPRHARFTQFVRSPSATLAYARQVVAGRELRHIGHNPLGGWMIVALLAVTALAAASGWLYVTDAYWGDERVEDLHEALAIALLALAALHVLGVVAASLRHRENLVASMIHGRKRAPADDDVA
jgi:cytochrome b